MFKRVLYLFAFCFFNFAFATKPMPIEAPFGLANNKADIEAQGVALIPAKFAVGDSNAQDLYLAVRVPDSIYPKALYKFSFNKNDQLTHFGIVLSEITSGNFMQLKKIYIRKHGAPSFRQESVDKAGQAYYYLNWGRPPKNYIGMTYLPNEQLLLISYFLKPGSGS